MLRRFHVVWLSRRRGRAGRACVDRLLADDMKQFAIALTCGLGLAYTVAFAMSWGWQKRNQQRIEALHLEEQQALDQQLLEAVAEAGKQLQKQVREHQQRLPPCHGLDPGIFPGPRCRLTW